MMYLYEVTVNNKFLGMKETWDTTFPLDKRSQVALVEELRKELIKETYWQAQREIYRLADRLEIPDLEFEDFYDSEWEKFEESTTGSCILLEEK